MCLEDVLDLYNICVYRDQAAPPRFSPKALLFGPISCTGVVGSLIPMNIAQSHCVSCEVQKIISPFSWRCNIHCLKNDCQVNGDGLFFKCPFNDLGFPWTKSYQKRNQNQKTSSLTASPGKKNKKHHHHHHHHHWVDCLDPRPNSLNPSSPMLGIWNSERLVTLVCV